MDALITVIDIAAKALTVLIFARVIISWVSPRTANPLVAFVYSVTEPLLRPVRSILPTMGGLDFSPIIVLLAIYFTRVFLIRSLLDLAQRLR